MLTIMIESSTLVARIAVNILRKTALANEVTQDELAKHLGINRGTMSSRFRKRELKLTEFLQLASLLGQNPLKILEQAEKQAAIASKEKSQPCLPG